MQDRDDLLDIRGAAQFLRVSEISLRRWTNAGRLPCLRIGGRRERRFRRSDLLAFLEENRMAPRPGVEARHRCALYTSDLERVESAAGFLESGGDWGAQTLSLLVAAKPVQRAVVEQLAKRRSVERDVTS